MATETIIRKTCDVFGTTKEVSTYTVTVTTDNTEGNKCCVREVNIDLSQRGLARLLAYLDRGVTKPGKGESNG